MVEDPNSDNGSDADFADFSDIPAVNALRRHLDNAEVRDSTEEQAAVRNLDASVSHHPEESYSAAPHWHNVPGPPPGPPPAPPWTLDGDLGFTLLATLPSHAPYYGGQPQSPLQDLPEIPPWAPQQAVRHPPYPYHGGSMHSASSHHDGLGSKSRAATEASSMPQRSSTSFASSSRTKPGAARATAGAPRQERPRLKGRTRSDLWCEIFLDQQMLEMSEFEVEKKLIGKGGCNTKGIFLATGSKILVCGQGAERGKVRRKRMSHDHLRIEIVSDRQAYGSFRRAFEMVINLIVPITADFDRFCMRQLRYKLEGTRYWIGSTTPQALNCLGQLLREKAVNVAPDALVDVRETRRSHVTDVEPLRDETLEAGVDRPAEMAVEPQSCLLTRSALELQAADPQLEAEAEEVAARHIRGVEEVMEEDDGDGWQ